jgi:hypothetical protein
MIKLILILLLGCATFSFDIVMNNKTILNEQPKLLAQVPNGQKFLIGDLNSTERDILYIANLKGTPY